MIIHKVYGPPGTGKTTRLMKIVGERVKCGVALSRIGYLSFSVTAAEIIRDRMKATQSDVRWFKTIHAAALKAMGMSGAVIDYADYANFSAKTRMYISNNEDEMHIGFNPAMRVYQLARNTMCDDREIIKEFGKFHECLVPARYTAFVETWTKYKQGVRKFDFLDMLLEYDRNGKPLPVDELLLDEGQDLSPLQWRVFNKMAANCSRCYMAGDDDQAIFGFIGGSEYGFLEYKADEEEVLRQSYRVPKVIGAEADRIIRQVTHRKEKDVLWKPEPGLITRMNLEPYMMPWRDYMKSYKDIMVLCRHRSGARKFSKDLNDISVAHNFEHDTLHAWKEAKAVYDYYKLKAGEQITSTQARRLLAMTAKRASEIEDAGIRTKVSKKDVPFTFDDKEWPFVGNMQRYAKLRQFVNREGWEALAKPPKISISTMHGAKGDEADLIVIVPDCTTTVKENMNKATEIRLAYVAMTRAKREVILMLPRDNFYIHHFFGG